MPSCKCNSILFLLCCLGLYASSKSCTGMGHTTPPKVFVLVCTGVRTSSLAWWWEGKKGATLLGCLAWGVEEQLCSRAAPQHRSP